MSRMNFKKKRFIKWINENFSDDARYDKISYSLLRIRNILLKDNPDFDTLSFELQKGLCVTTYMISMSGKRFTMNELSFFGKEPSDENIKKYDIEYGFSPPTYIEIPDEDNIGKTKFIEQL